MSPKAVASGRRLPLVAAKGDAFDAMVTESLRGRDIDVTVRSGPRVLTSHAFDGTPRKVALPITFTPFASAAPCSARCVFCSETLVHKDARTLSSSLRPGPHYVDALTRALAALRGLPIGISLSGLEAADDRDWLFSVLDPIDAHARTSPVGERVLYSNFVGFTEDARALVDRLRAFGLDRLEVSRHARELQKNQAIMRLRPAHVAAYESAFDATLRAVAREVPVRLVCVLQARGVRDLDDVERYLTWAASLGVTDVVFRELSRLGSEYLPNRTARTVAEERVPIDGLIDAVWPRDGAPQAGFVPALATRGYYFFNIAFRHESGARVTFETSDYEVMKSRHDSDVVYKLVFHANGALSADWDPDRNVLLRPRTEAQPTSSSGAAS